MPLPGTGAPAQAANEHRSDYVNRDAIRAKLQPILL